MKILIDGQTLQTDEINRGIGVYFRNVVNQLVKIDFVHDWYVTVSDKSLLNRLDPFAREKLNILEDARFSNKGLDCTDEKHNSTYTAALKEYIASQKIDVYWNPNPVMQNVLFPNEALGVKVAATFYDMIPHVYKKHYLDQWPVKYKTEYYRRLTYLKNSYLMFISQASRNDYVKWAGKDSKNYLVTFLGVDTRNISPAEFLTARENTVLYVGGNNFRKNLNGALEAFSLAKKKYKNSLMDQTIFQLVCHLSDESRLELEKKLNDLEIKDSVQLLGYVSDGELSALYRRCGTFFFPSLYEGFGLPVLEALAYGCNVLSADNSSLTEVGSQFVTYCNASDTANMADQLYASVQTAQSETSEIRNKRIKYAHNLSWDETAMQTHAFLTARATSSQAKKKKIAILTPWPPQKSGIAYYMYKVVEEIRKYFDITVFYDNSAQKVSPENLDNVAILPIAEFENQRKQFDEVVYQLGNNTQYHTEIYKLADQYPGIIELHDLNIHPFLQHMSYLHKKDVDKKYYKEAIAYYGQKGVDLYSQLEATGIFVDVNAYFMVEHICSKNKKVIVHNKWAQKQLSNFDDVALIPLASFPSGFKHEDADISAFKAEFNIPDDRYIVACLGFTNKNKRYEKIIESIAMLNKNGYPTQLVFLGDAGGNSDDVQNVATYHEIEDRVLISGYMDDAAYYRGIYSSDIIINLRYPSMGESSATLLQALQYGKPVLISNIGQYREFPHDVAWKVDVSEQETAQLYAYLKYLFENPDVRMALGKNGQSFANHNFNIEKIGQSYFEEVSTT